MLTNFPDLSQSESVHVLDILARYQFMELDLIDMIPSATEPVITHTSFAQ